MKQLKEKPRFQKIQKENKQKTQKKKKFENEDEINENVEQSLASLEDEKVDLAVEVWMDRKKGKKKMNSYFKSSKFISKKPQMASENVDDVKIEAVDPTSSFEGIELNQVGALPERTDLLKDQKPQISSQNVNTWTVGKVQTPSSYVTEQNEVETMSKRIDLSVVHKPLLGSVFPTKWKPKEVIISGLKVDDNSFRSLLPGTYINDIIIDAFTSILAAKFPDISLLNFSIHHVKSLINQSFNKTAIIRWCQKV